VEHILRVKDLQEQTVLQVCLGFLLAWVAVELVALMEA
jgi:hypothetical protein